MAQTKTKSKPIKGRPKLPFRYKSKSRATSRLPLERLHEIVKADEKGKRDVTQSARSLRFVPSTIIREGGHSDMLVIDGQHFEFTEHSWGQFARMLGFPAAYASKVNADHRADIVKYHMKDDPGKGLMFRVRDCPANGAPEERKIRAVVKPTFSRFDNVPLVEHLSHVLRKEHIIRSCSLSDSGLYIMLGDKSLYDTYGGSTIERLAKVTAKTDPVAVGMSLRSSETDHFRFQVDQEVYRLICTNGMMGWAPQAMFKKSKQWGDILAFREACSEALREVDLLKSKSVGQLRGARNTLYEKGRKGHERVLKSLFKTFNLTAGGNLDDVLIRWDQYPSGDPVDDRHSDAYTKFGLVDALTRTAQGLLNRNEQHQWEVAAGRYLAASSN